ncbi:putative methyltransferase DDB_G0268948 [Lissotriton helveticus]
MTFRFYERKEHASLYRKYMIREPSEVQGLILSYLEKKKNPYELAVDVGCGTGDSTRFLAPRFQKVVGIDISEAQIQEAKSVGSPSNVSYRVGCAENLPFEDSSVDLITTSVAAHWFNAEEFLKESDRVLKPNGCLAIYSLHPHYNLYYKECSQSLTHAFNEGIDFLLYEYGAECVAENMITEYKAIFEAVQYADKTRVTKILLKRTISIAELMGYVESLGMFQNFLIKNPEEAKEFLQTFQERILGIMSSSSAETELEISNNYCCVLACKSGQ